MKSKIIRMINYILSVLMVIFAVLVIMSKISLWNVRLFVVKSGSMAPSIKTGSLIVSVPKSSYEVGDIVTFNPANPKTKNETITHRIQAIHNDEITTKGDANNADDHEIISASQIIGQKKIALPYVGYSIKLVESKVGFVVIIALCAIIIYEEVKSMRKEIKEIALKRKKENIK